MSLHVAAAAARRARAHAEKTYPEECCGALVGVLPADFTSLKRTVVVAEIVELANSWGETGRERRYAIEGRALAELEARLATEGKAVLGFYHSHPDVPAWPSPYDLLRAWPSYSYWIIAVNGGKSAANRSWVLDPNRETFHEESFAVLEAST